MQITLNQEEIEMALDIFVRSRIQVAEGQKIVFDLKAGRGENGFTASLDIVPVDTPKKTTFQRSESSAPRSVATVASVNEVIAENTSASKPVSITKADTKADDVSDTDTSDDAEDTPVSAEPTGRSLFSKNKAG